MQTSGFDADREVSGNIGVGVLKQFNLTFDYPRQRLLLEQNRLYGLPDVSNRAGFLLKRQGDIWSVRAVYAQSPAAEAGLRVGDVVERVNGETTAVLDDEALAAKLKAPVGTALDLRVRGSGSNSRQLKVRLSDWLR